MPYSIRAIETESMGKNNDAMPIVTIVVSDILTLLGLVTYFAWKPLGAPTQSWTALIPAFVGIPMGALGLLALNPKLRMHTMHTAVLLALLGFIAAVGRLAAKPQAAKTVGGVSQIIMAIVTGIYVLLCVRSFVAARRNRLNQP